MKPHKHAELIKAWADGAKVQIKPRVHNAWIDVDNPCWYDDEEYRIKPEPKLVTLNAYDTWTSCVACGQKVTEDLIHTCSPQTKPLSDEEIDKILESLDVYIDTHAGVKLFARAIEERHGIK